MAAISFLQHTPFLNALFSSAHIVPADLTLASVLLRHVYLDLPTSAFPGSANQWATLWRLMLAFPKCGWSIPTSFSTSLPLLCSLPDVFAGYRFWLSGAEDAADDLLLKIWSLCEFVFCGAPYFWAIVYDGLHIGIEGRDLVVSWLCWEPPD